jgi:hypothetical protein
MPSDNGAPLGDDIEKLKKKLYSRGKEAPKMDDIRSPLTHEEVDVPKTFAKPVEDTPAKAEVVAPIGALMMTRKKGLSFAAKFFIMALAFFIIAFAAAAYFFFGGGNIISPQNIDMQIVTPSLVDSGKQGSVQVLIDNRNTAALTLVDMLVDYPSGTRDPANPTQPLTHTRTSIGTIDSGQQIKKAADGIFYGAEGSQQKVTVTLEYSVAGSNAVYEKTADATFLIGSSPVSLSIQTPTDVVAGQPFTVDVTVQSNASTPLQNVVVQGQYPFGFTPTSVSPTASAGNTFWKLGTMQPGSSQVLHLTGTLDGQEGDTRVLRFAVGSNTDSTDSTIEVPILTVPQTLTVRKPFISAKIAINGATGKNIAVSAGKPVEGTVTWTNNLTTAVSNVQLVLTLTGPALDKQSVGASGGFYQSQNGTITWGPSQDAELASVAPGQTGSLQFSFSTLSPGAGGTLITNPTISMSLGVQGTRQDSASAPEQVSNVASASATLASQLSLASQALHFTGPIPNTGAMPPKAESDTSYTINWTVKNSSNTIGNAVVTTQLPPYVRYVSAGQSGVTYDSNSRIVTWNLGDLPAGIGYSSPAKQTYFQIILTPSASQIGSAPALTGNVVLKGQDRFANVAVEADANPATTLLSEQGFQSGMDIVVPK